MKLQLKKELEQLKQELIAYYHNSGIEASGNWAKSIDIQELPNGFAMVASNYINGRRPGKAPPSQIIEKWIIQKGISSKLGKEISVSSLAFLIARKIARNGWKPKQGRNNPKEQIITPQRVQQIIDKITPIYANNLTSELLLFLKTNPT